MNNKNPFAVPQTTYTPQPPLPPGPPPPQPAQPDYSAYWAAAAAAQAQQSATTAYNPQWPVQQPGQPAAPRPTPEQSALFANYGYGGQQWQQQQQQRPPQHFQPAPAAVQQAPPPPQPAYNPYQPQAGVYQQPYVPQAAPPQPIPPQIQYIPQAPAVQQFQQQPQQQFFPQQQQQQQNRTNNRHNQHNTSQHLPPAKRQRFDGPSQHRNQPPPPPQFQPPPPPPVQQPPTGPIGGGVGVGINASQNQNFSGGRGGGPGANQVPLGGGRGGFGGRGGNANSRGRGMGVGRGGRGRGGMYNSMNGRGGGPSQSGSFRQHGAGGRGFGNRDNRRGGSFAAGGGQNHPHQQQHQQQGLPQQPQQQNQQQNFGGSFRNRHQNFARGGRHDTSGLPHGPKEMTASSGFSAGKKEENRRTLTDFKIVGLRIAALGWSWGTVPEESGAKDTKEEVEEGNAPSPVEQEVSEQKPEVATPGAPAVPGDTDASPSVVQNDAADDTAVKQEGGSTPLLPPPPSRIRIYFHTPVTADDAHPITAQGSFTHGQGHDTFVRKGKRKKLEDDDGDLEDGRGPPPPPPQHSGFDHDASTATASADHEGGNAGTSRASVAPSATETASEGDWLMAVSGEGEGDGTTDAHAADGDNLHDIDAEGEPDDYEDGNDYDDVDAQMGGIDDSQSHLATEGLLDEHTPLHEDEDGTPPGLSGHSGPSVELHTEGDHDLSLSFAATEGAGGSFTASVEHSALPDATTAADPAAEHVVSTTEAAVDADKTHSTQTQPSAEPLQTAEVETASTAHDTEEQEVTSQLANHTSPTQAEPNGYLEVPIEETQQLMDSEPDHPPSPSTSTATLVLPSIPEVPTQSDSNPGGVEHSKAESARVPSANRLSISYAGATRRLVIDAGVVDKLRVFRHEARIEVHMKIDKETAGQYKGILIEGVSDSSATYHLLELSADSSEDNTVPPFETAALPLHTVLTAYLDKDRPLSEPRWVKTGDVQDWLKSMFGRMFWVAGEAADGWEKKIEVVDADPPPTIWTVLEAWAVNSNVGTSTERQRFLRTHMTETDNILEVLLRLVRGERASYSQSTPAISAPSVSGPLLSALSHGSAHGAQQTHVSLAVLAIFRLAVEFAKKVDDKDGKSEVEARVGEIIRCLPSHLIYKSLDGICKEWRLEKKGGGR